MINDKVAITSYEQLWHSCTCQLQQHTYVEFYIIIPQHYVGLTKYFIRLAGILDTFWSIWDIKIVFRTLNGAFNLNFDTIFVWYLTLTKFTNSHSTSFCKVYIMCSQDKQDAFRFCMFNFNIKQDNIGPCLAYQNLSYAKAHSLQNAL